ncbi:MAG: AAA family ATPase [Candidatus Latescibacteria bacterium]|nr:AAA family ATPase [Candidatus Latescibacterota bacterium]MBT4137856.1 AAA family ATPase [Candidatus Latescibacterota bacterium]
MQHTFQSLSIIDQILMTMDEKDRRRPLLYQLRRQLQEDEITFEDARRTVVELEGALEKVTAPANRVGTLLSAPDKGVAYIQVGGAEYYANIDARIEEDLLKVGTRVLVNDAFAIVGDMGESPSGTVGKIVDVLDDGRLQVGNEQGTQSNILIRGTDLKDVNLKTGEEVRIDPGYRVALEKMAHTETKDYYLEEVPELPWDKVGGHDDAIQAIQDTIEMPVLHPELFERFEYSTPKGFLLYGPPGCGKTLIGKATAYNLEQQVQADGLGLKACFMHIKGPEILNMWLGESERKVREIFSQAREKRREGFLPVVFIDEAESVLGTRRAVRSHNISNTVVPMFCSEMDGIESLQDIVIILTSNRPDMIDPAILRPGRIDRKIKVGRPDEASAKEILGIYLTDKLPIDKKELQEFDGDVSKTVEDIVTRTSTEIFAKRDDTRFLEVTLRSGRKDVLTRGDLCSGAILESIVRRAKEYAIKRSIASGKEEGIGFDDMFLGVETEFAENEIFPPSENTEDWLKLLDYDPENVVRISPIRPERNRRTSRQSVI